MGGATTWHVRGNFALFECLLVTTTVEEWQCIRVATMSALSVLTWMACIVSTIRLIYNSRERVNTTLAIFYFVLLQTTVCVLHWTALSETFMDIIIQYFKVGVYSVVCYSYVLFALRSLKMEDKINRLLNPIFFGFFLLLTAMIGLVLGGFLSKNASENCLSDVWIILASINFIIALLFMVVGFFLSRRMDKKSYSEKYKDTRKSRLWILVCVNFSTSIFSLGYEIYNRITVKSAAQCDIFVPSSIKLQVIVYLFIRTVDLFVPVWSCLFVFRAGRTSTPIVNTQQQRVGLLKAPIRMTSPLMEKNPYVLVDPPSNIGSPIFAPPSYGSSDGFSFGTPGTPGGGVRTVGGGPRDAANFYSFGR